MADDPINAYLTEEELARVPGYGGEGCTCGTHGTPARSCPVHWLVAALEASCQAEYQQGYDTGRQMSLDRERAIIHLWRYATAMANSDPDSAETPAHIKAARVAVYKALREEGRTLHNDWWHVTADEVGPWPPVAQQT